MAKTDMQRRRAALVKKAMEAKRREYERDMRVTEGIVSAFLDYRAALDALRRRVAGSGKARRDVLGVLEGVGDVPGGEAALIFAVPSDTGAGDMGGDDVSPFGAAQGGAMPGPRATECVESPDAVQCGRRL